jgi:cell division transport system permease protein
VAGLATRAELAGNAGVIATLRLVGARDRLIRGAVTRRSTLRALAGAVAGAAAGLALVSLLPRDSEQGFFLAGIGLAGWSWLLPLLVPLIAALIAWAAAATTAGRWLRRRS